MATLHWRDEKMNRIDTSHARLSGILATFERRPFGRNCFRDVPASA
jgi:hypothetical protein